MPDTGGRPTDGEVVRRTLFLKRTIEGFRGEWFSFTRLLKLTGLPKGTLHRYLTIFVEEHELERDVQFRIYRKKHEEVKRV